MQWVRLETGLPDHPKVLALIQAKRHKAVMVYVLGLAYCGRHELDGYVPASALPFIHGTKADAAALVEVGMWHIAEAGWEINGWADFQPTSTERSAAKQKAQKAAQARWQKPPLIDLRAVRDAQA